MSRYTWHADRDARRKERERGETGAIQQNGANTEMRTLQQREWQVKASYYASVVLHAMKYAHVILVRC